MALVGASFTAAPLTGIGTATLTSGSTTIGNNLVVWGYIQSGTAGSGYTGFSVADGGNTWTVRTVPQNAGRSAFCAFAPITAGGVRTIVVTGSGGVGGMFGRCTGGEFNGGTIAVDQTVTGTAFGASPVALSAPGNNATSTALVVWAIAIGGGTTNSNIQQPPTTGYTAGDSNQNDSTDSSGACAFKIESSVVTSSVSATVGAFGVDGSAAGLWTFKFTAGAATSNQAPMMPKSLRLGAGMGFGRFIQAVAAVLNNITGTAGFQNGADKLAATATETISGTAALTNGADKIAILATETFSGTAALKNGADALAATAQERFAGTAGLTGGPDKLTATGAEVFASTVALKGGPDKLAATATETISGTAALKNGADHLSATDGSTPGTTGNVPTINAPLVFGTLLNRS